MKEKNNQFNLTTIFKGFLTAFNIHRGLIPTLKDLFMNPKIVVHYYIEGKIDKHGYNKYFSPGRFFVTILAILSIFTFFAGELSYDIINELALQGEENEEKIKIQETTTKMVTFFFNHPMFGFLLLILPSSLSTRLFWKNNKYNLAKHLVINVYCFCFIALIIGILSLFFNQEEYLMYAMQQLQDNKHNIKTDILWKFEFYTYSVYSIPILYYFYCFKNIFKLSWISSIFKTLASLTLTSVVILLSIVIPIIILSTSY